MEKNPNDEVAPITKRQLSNLLMRLSLAEATANAAFGYIRDNLQGDHKTEILKTFAVDAEKQIKTLHKQMGLELSDKEVEMIQDLILHLFNQAKE